MSRIAKKGLAIPAKTEVTVSGSTVTVKGPKGTLTIAIPAELSVKIEDNTVMVTKNGELENEALWGAFTSHVKNLIVGASEGYTKKLILEGVGFKADVKGTDLMLALGFSHPVKIAIPSDVKVASEKGVVTFSSIDKDAIGQFTAYIRSLKKPEPYKGKGFHYDKEVIRRKQGKKSV